MYTGRRQKPGQPAPGQPAAPGLGAGGFAQAQPNTNNPGVHQHISAAEQHIVNPQVGSQAPAATPTDSYPYPAHQGPGGYFAAASSSQPPVINADQYNPATGLHQQQPQFADQYPANSQYGQQPYPQQIGLDGGLQPPQQAVGLDGVPSPTVPGGPVATFGGPAPLERYHISALTSQHVADIISDTAPHPTKAVDERTYHPGVSKVPHDVYVQHSKSHGTFRKVPGNFTQKLHDENQAKSSKSGKRRTANAEIVSSATAQRAMLLDRELADLVSATLSDPHADHAAVHHVVSVLDLATSAEYIISAIEMIFVGVQGLLAGIAFLMILLLAPEMGSNSDINSLLASVEPNLSKAMLILIHISFVGAAVRIGRKVDFRRARLRNDEANVTVTCDTIMVLTAAIFYLFALLCSALAAESEDVIQYKCFPWTTGVDCDDDGAIDYWKFLMIARAPLCLLAWPVLLYDLYAEITQTGAHVQSTTFSIDVEMTDSTKASGSAARQTANVGVSPMRGGNNTSAFPAPSPAR